MELWTTWTIDDVADANDALDAWHEAKRVQQALADQKAKAKP
jgi:hypothetical protein